MGMGKMGFGYDPAAATAKQGGAAANNDGEAAKRFGTAKAISSDQYFQRGQYDEHENAQARERLSTFAGKSGFGSAEYYGRDESGPSRSSGGAADLGSVSEAARDFASKFVGQAADDFSSIKKVVAAGSTKLGEMLQDMQVRFEN
ncbi:hypothetical protein BDK51DRAFT_16236 [Blyttiomyces helicus]|uniref:Uncharacterized protein n=1 Tax=Blyttiomyces helicus TaxID=388810 RepID=A0A4P9W8Y9_9FUNG|nr:hypothetical protein BDK51DRAFT_16236 [Blyttiomyces helicus]|eukprot:RKO86646.1 hypothetical protein BDK51DRAFT_16236 [Blyttiomyces helicus]